MIKEGNEGVKEMNLQPVNGHVLVEIPKDESGVIIPTALSDSTQEGIILAIDSNCALADVASVGDKVRWERYAEADGEFDYPVAPLKQIKAVLIDSKRITAVWKNK